MTPFQDRIALVTGAAQGIGAATARALAAAGAKVIVADLPSPQGEQVADEIGGEFVALDVASEPTWAGAVAGILARHGRLDVLVNSAGIVGDVVNGSLERMRLADWRRVMAVNLDGTFLGCRQALAAMKPAGRGAIVNVASVGAYYPTLQNAAYGASKGGVTALTKTVAYEGSQDSLRIRCNSVHPGQIRTPMLESIHAQIVQRFDTAGDPRLEALVAGCARRSNASPSAKASRRTWPT
jgi:3(or 17)beta-hydroxysteroid dehydrogenase